MPEVPPDDKQTPIDLRTTSAGSSAREAHQVGPYQFLQKLGEGGMGEVWLAEQTAPVRRRVALKVIKQGMDTKQVVARFEVERQALAMMNHPAVAKVFDAGTTPDGRPYFVMEYVKGVPITEHCDRYKLTNRERLGLFLQVCEGVQHAHQRAIIHRDLKPSNVLVTEQDGKRLPKIIDFGVAKAIAQRLTERTMYTELGVLIGTPEYMSPEQAELTGEDVDTRTDVYSLGVILYELLAGALPFEPKELRGAGFDGMRRMIREEQPKRPSARLSTLGGGSVESAGARRVDLPTLQRQLAGDLDWITMKALEKDRARRYGSPMELAADVERYLTDQPVLASSPSAAYRARKFARRHKKSVVAVGAGFLGLIVFVVTVTVQAGRIAAERDRANAEAGIAQAVNDFLNRDLLSAVAPSAEKGRGIDVRMRDVLEVAAARLDESAAPGGPFQDKPLVEAAIRSTLGSTYLSSGEPDAALEQYRREVELRTRHQGENHIQTAWALRGVALAMFRQGRTEEAERELLRVLQYEKHATDDEAQYVAEWKSTLGLVYEDMGRFEEAEALLLDVLRYQERELGADHPDAAVTMTSLANIYQRTGRYAECEALAKKVLEITVRRVGEEAPETLYIVSNLGNVLANQGRMDEAQEYMIRALEAKKKILGPENPSTLNSMNNVAEVHGVLGHWAAAEELHRETYALRSRVLGEDHPRTLYSLVRVALATAHNGRPQEAEPVIVDALERMRKVRGADHPDTQSARSVYGTVLLVSGRFAEAEAVLRSLVDDMKGSARSAGVRELAQAQLALALMARNEKSESVALLREALPALPLFDSEAVQMVESAIESLERWHASEPGAGYGEEAARLRELVRGKSAAPGLE